MSGTSFAASTIDLDDLSARVQRLAAQCRERSDSLVGASRLLPVHWHSRANTIAIDVAQISRDLETVGRGLASTSQAYSEREGFLRAIAHEASSTLFWGLGRALVLVAPAVLPVVVGGVTALLAACTISGRRPEEIIGALVTQATRLLPAAEEVTATTVMSSPAFVSGLEFAVSGIDDFAAGVMGLPLPLISTLGERGLGFSDPSAVAGIIVGVAGTAAGSFLRETPVTVTRVSAPTVAGPQGLEQLIGRIPRADPQMPQVRIERYEGAADGHPSFIVYLGGTIDAALMATDEPWDMTSNIGALAGMDAGSDRAAIEAMRAAGISSDNLVTLVGHSQGGLLAARIAQSQEFRVGDVVTVGAPIHQVPIPREVTLTAIEHTEDLVPTLGGIALAGVGVGTGAAAAASLGGAGHSGSTTTVRRSALAGITPSPGDALPGHNLTRYVETGRVMDVSSDTQLTSLRSRLAANATGTAETTFWRAERLTR